MSHKLKLLITSPDFDSGHKHKLSQPIHMVDLMSPWTELCFQDDTTLRLKDIDFESDHVNFLRYTGIDDSNGVEVYEGDQVLIEFRDGPVPGPHKVFMRFGCWYAEHMKPLGLLTGDFEVVGDFLGLMEKERADQC